jgi:hypothetical protein
MRASLIAVASMCVAAAAGCGATSRATATDTASSSTPVPQAPSSAACTSAAQAELVAIARRIYAQAATGRNATAATRRIRGSRALAAAVAAGDAASTQAALQPLLKHQITRIEIVGPHGLLARHGTTAAYGPVRGAITVSGRQVGSYVLAVSRKVDYTSLVHELTGATATFHTGASSGADASLPATMFPTGNSVISLKLPHVPASVCGPTPADTRAATVGFVGRRLLDAEQHGAGAQRAVRHAEKNPAFRAAVAAGDPAAVRAAIVGFFQDKHFHIVRVRAWNGTHVINDVGGPHVLSPATGSIRGAGGAVVGRFMLSIQDDTGYIKLMHRFTGANVTLSTAAGVVPGSNVVPGPPFASGLRAVRYHGRDWRAFGLLGAAFPSGPVQVSLLVH